MKILLNATGATLGGSWSYALQQLPSLNECVKERGHELRVLAQADLAAALRDINLEVQSLRFRSTAGRVVWEQTALRRIACNYDVLVSDFNFGPIRPPILSVMVVHNPNYWGAGRAHKTNQRFSRRIKIRFSQLCTKSASHVVAISKSLRDQILLDDPELESKTSVIVSGAPKNKEISQPDNHGIFFAAPFFLCVANAYPHKRLDFLIRAWIEAKLNEISVPNLVLVGAGQDNLKKPVKYIHSLGLESSYLHLGPIRNPAEVRWLMRHCHAYVSTSSLEAWPLTPEEAMVEGAPLLLSDIPAHREVTQNQATYIGLFDLQSWIDAFMQSIGEHSHLTWPDRQYTWRNHAEDLVNELERLRGWEECLAAT